MPPIKARWCELREKRDCCAFLLFARLDLVERLAGLRLLVVLAGLRLVAAFLAGVFLRAALTVAFFLAVCFFFVVLFEFAIRSIGAIG